MQEHMTPTQISTRLLRRGVRHGVLGCGGKGGGKGGKGKGKAEGEGEGEDYLHEDDDG